MKVSSIPILLCLPLFIVTSCADMDAMDDDLDLRQHSSALIPGQPVYPDGVTMNGLVAKRVAKKVNFWGKKEIVPEFGENKNEQAAKAYWEQIK